MGLRRGQAGRRGARPARASRGQRVRRRVRRDEGGDRPRARFADRGTLLSDPGFLRQWLDVLESLPGYGGTNDEANIGMLRRLIAEVQRRADPDGAPDAGRDIGYAG